MLWSIISLQPQWYEYIKIAKTFILYCVPEILWILVVVCVTFVIFYSGNEYNIRTDTRTRAGIEFMCVDNKNEESDVGFWWKGRRLKQSNARLLLSFVCASSNYKTKNATACVSVWRAREWIFKRKDKRCSRPQICNRRKPQPTSLPWAQPHLTIFDEWHK